MHIVSHVYVYIIVLTLIVIPIGAQTKQYGYTGNYDERTKPVRTFTTEVKFKGTKLQH